MGGWRPATAQKLSLAIAAVLFLTYLCTLAFSLVTHKDIFSGKHLGVRTELIKPDFALFHSVSVTVVAVGRQDLLHLGGVR